MKITFFLFVLFFSFTNRCAAVVAEKKPSFSMNTLHQNELTAQKTSEKGLEASTIFTKDFLARMAVELIASFVLIASLLFIPNLYSPATLVLTLIGAVFLLGYSFYEIAKIFKGKDFRSIPSFLVHLLIALLGIFTFKKYK
jgi:VIT1/CCC1 family predicted Fe2+/Mn2+ transporter